MSYNFTLLRHGQSVANRDRVIQGQQDSPLSDKGITQVQALAAHWREQGSSFDKVIASPLARARQTAELIAKALSIEIEFDDNWKEWDQGAAEGMESELARKMYLEKPPSSIFDPVYDHGESEWDLYSRATHGLVDLLDRAPGDYLVVAHGAILGAAVRSALGIPPQLAHIAARLSFDNTGYAILIFDSNHPRWILQSLNNTNHLRSPKTELPGVRS